LLDAIKTGCNVMIDSLDWVCRSGPSGICECNAHSKSFISSYHSFYL